MFDLHRLGAFAITAFVIIVIPGPSVLFAIGQALAHGRRAAVASVFGNACGVYIQAVCVAVGIGAVVQRSIAVYAALKLLGVAYLIFLGTRALLTRRGRHEHEIAATPAVRTRFRDGLTVGATNPKGFVLFSTILPQFVDRAAGSVPIQMLGLGLVAAGIAVVSDSAWAMLAGTARDWFARAPRRADHLQRAGGVMMIAVGVNLALARRHE
jgi:threonine/homoserine/homoserine lactone efflux protein